MPRIRRRDPHMQFKRTYTHENNLKRKLSAKRADGADGDGTKEEEGDEKSVNTLRACRCVCVTAYKAQTLLPVSDNK